MESARRGGEWLLARQRLPPHSGWAQQYDDAGQPAGMRRFELPALASWETRHAVDALDALARATGEARWCAPVLAAAAWLRSAAIRPGCWARFYGLDDGQPLFFDADGTRVVAPAEARPGYDWQGDFGIAALLRRVGMGEGDVTPAPLPGDPGACEGGARSLRPGARSARPHRPRGPRAVDDRAAARVAVRGDHRACDRAGCIAARSGLGSAPMIACLDLEGVLVPEIWINVAERTGIAALRRTTRDEPDYDKLMRGRLAILDEHGSACRTSRR